MHGCMARRVVMVAGGLLLAAAEVSAGVTGSGAPIWGQAPGCERNAYCVLNYWMPFTYRWRSYIHGPTRYTFAPNKFPEIPVTFHPIPYRCRTVTPRVYALDHYYPGIRMPGDIPAVPMPGDRAAPAYETQGQPPQLFADPAREAQQEPFEGQGRERLPEP